jgi:Nif-specific regulatory protein
MEGERPRAARSLISLYEISKILSASLNLEPTLRAVLNILSSYMDMRRGVVAIVGEDGALNVVAASGLSPQAVRDGAADLPAEVAGRILSGQMPFVTENVADDPLLADWLRIPDALDDETISFIAVPVKTFGKPFGVLAIARVWDGNAGVSFGEDVRFLTMVANLVAQAVKLSEKIAGAPPSPRALALPAEAATTAHQLDRMIGASRAMQQVFAQVHLVAPTRSTVVLRGESGTGKELIARAVHMLSPRHDRPFIKVNCAALPDTLLESELFGHEKGAFTGATSERKGRFELADGGSLFLDEIGDVSPAFQAKLLRVLQEREFERVGGSRTLKVDVRLICATNRNLEEAVAKGDFRADLYYRINVVPIFIPALRERRDDIPALAQHFLEIFNRENGRRLTLSADALRALAACSFPGNVRELENCIQRVATLTRGEVIDDISLPCQTAHCHCTTLLPRTALQASGEVDGGGEPPDGAPGADWRAEDAIEDLEALPQRERLIRVMERTGWVQAKAARLLGLTPRQIGYALKKYNIEIKRL